MTNRTRRTGRPARRLRLRARAVGRQEAPRARRIRFGRVALRPDERRDVGRAAPPMEALHDRAQRFEAGPAARSTSPPAAAISRSASRAASAVRAASCVTDINAAMLDEGRDAAARRGLAGNVDYVLADAEALPFAAASFHCVTIGFGLRNVTDKERGAREPRIGVLEAGRPAARARVLAARTWARSRRCTSSIRSRYCRASANGSPAMPRATATSPSRSAAIRIKRR